MCHFESLSVTSAEVIPRARDLLLRLDELDKRIQRLQARGKGTRKRKRPAVP